MPDISRSVGFLLAKAYQRACALYKEQFENYDLTPQQYGLLRFLWEEDGLTQVELSSRSQIDRTTIGGLIDRLEQSGLLQRLPHPEDRRAYLICLTKAGRNLEKELTPLGEELQQRILSPLTGDEQDALVTILQKLR
ncbi:MAG TPA: MarR family transcriptional regulator [Geobacteraceae bacterium]|nr:MarR family transcriptional regulator [Geobacteraceae bacterium]